MAGNLVSAAWGIVSALLNDVVVAAIIILMGFIAGKLIGRLVFMVLKEIEFNAFLKNSFKLSFPADELFGFLVQFFIYFMSIILSLQVLRIQGLLFNLVSIGMVVMIFVSVILSLVDFIPNVYAGVYMHHKGKLKVGNTVRVGNLEAKVRSIDLVDTQMTTKEGDSLFVPNFYLMRNFVVVRKK